jgi:hypothetical protein
VKNEAATFFNRFQRLSKEKDYSVIRVEKHMDKVIANHGWEAETYSKKLKSQLLCYYLVTLSFVFKHSFTKGGTGRK